MMLSQFIRMSTLAQSDIPILSTLLNMSIVFGPAACAIIVPNVFSNLISLKLWSVTHAYSNSIPQWFTPSVCDNPNGPALSQC